MKSTMPEKVETTLVEYSSLKKEGEKPMITATATTTQKKIPSEKVTSKINVAKPAAKKTASKKKSASRAKTSPVSTSVAKAAIANQPSKKLSVSVDVEKPETKMDIAVRIFSKNYPQMKRIDIILLFMSEAKLTKAGASTYFKKDEESPRRILNRNTPIIADSEGATAPFFESLNPVTTVGFSSIVLDNISSNKGDRK